MPAIDTNRPLTVIFGCGYVGTRLARSLLADGNPVRACSRHLDRLAPLAELGAELFPIDAGRPKQFGPALRGTLTPTVVYSIPPVPGLPGGESVRRATQAALGVGARSFIYLGTTGLYGNTPDPEWVDESTPTDLGDLDMAPRHQDEAAVEGATQAGLRTVILRMAAIYGPGRGVRKRMLSGQYKIIDEGQHFISRIHVDDLVHIIRVAAEKAQQGSLYLVADDRPTRQREYAEWLSKRLGQPMPPSIAALAPGAQRTYLRGRRVRNDKLKRELGITLRYPSFVEGEAQIEAEDRGEAAPFAPAPVEVGTESSTQIVAAAPPVPPTVRSGPAPLPPSARPPSVRHYSAIAADDGRGVAGSDERLSISTNLGRPFGLTRVVALHELIPPGRRIALPHAHSEEEELVYVLEGEPEVWLDGVTYRLGPGDVIGLPGGTGIAHTIINNGSLPARLLVVGEHRRTDRVGYPLHSAVEAALPNENRWSDGPKHRLGPHDALPDAQRDK